MQAETWSSIAVLCCTVGAATKPEAGTERLLRRRSDTCPAGLDMGFVRETSRQRGCVFVRFVQPSNHQVIHASICQHICLSAPTFVQSPVRPFTHASILVMHALATGMIGSG